jgi:hypothetical protein
MLSSGRPRSISSLLSDWTSGLVGGLYTKLDENDDEREDGFDLKASVLFVGGTILSYWKGEKSRGGDVAIQEWRADGNCSTLWLATSSRTA